MNDNQPDAAQGPCPNCGDATPGRFCPTCGQRRGDRRVTLRRLLADAIEDQFALNGTLPRTVHALLLKPGLLTSEYIAGRVARYVPPFRLYLLTSFLFFLVLTITNDSPVRINNRDDPDPDADSAVVADSAATPPGLNMRVDTTDGSPPDSVDLPFLPQAMRQRVRERFRELSELEDGRLGDIITRELRDRMPAAIFLMLPIYAGILSLLYIRHRRYYVEHFIFALHVHSFTFLLFTVERFAEMIWAWLELPLMIWSFVYGFLALRRVYGQSFLRTAVKYFVLGMVYAPLLFATILGIMLYVVMTAPL